MSSPGRFVGDSHYERTILTKKSATFAVVQYHLGSGSQLGGICESHNIDSAAFKRCMLLSLLTLEEEVVFQGPCHINGNCRRQAGRSETGADIDEPVAFVRDYFTVNRTRRQTSTTSLFNPADDS